MHKSAFLRGSSSLRNMSLSVLETLTIDKHGKSLDVSTEGCSSHALRHRVVQGMTNKEIAEHLFISINTVITHRRNIARKLQIHSPAGLTIYAIVNHWVDISSVKL